MANKQWYSFYNKLNGKRLASISVKEATPGEIKATKELLAYGEGFKASDIQVKRENR